MSGPSEQEYLANYNIQDFDVPLTTVDLCIFTVHESALQILLIRRKDHPGKGRWALPGGFVDVTRDGSLEDTARRKLSEKTGVRTPYLEQVLTTGGPTRDPRGWSMTVVYLSLLAAEHVSIQTGESATEVAWVPVEQALKKRLAFDHVRLLERSLQRLRSKVAYTLLPVNLLPEAFTLGELQQTFEIILGRPIEKKSFRRRVLEAGSVEETGKMKATGTRPAKLYRAISGSDGHLFSRNLEGARR